MLIGSCFFRCQNLADTDSMLLVEFAGETGHGTGPTLEVRVMLVVGGGTVGGGGGGSSKRSSWTCMSGIGVDGGW